MARLERAQRHEWAEAELAARASSPDQHLLRLSGSITRTWRSDHAEALYDLSRLGPGARRCPTCLRAFGSAPTNGTAPQSGYCSTGCRLRAQDPARRDLPRVWQACEVCSTDFISFGEARHGRGGGGLRTCPPAWPASAFRPHEHGEADLERKRRLGLEARRNYLARHPEVREAEARHKRELRAAVSAGSAA
jgi:hypothetical protein